MPLPFMLGKTSLAEVHIGGRYILHQQPNEQCLALYKQAMEKLEIQLDEEDEKIFHFMLQHPWLMGMIDAGLAITEPHSQVRRKIFVLLAIFETQPQYADLFLPQKRGRLYVLRIFFVLCRAAICAVLGIVLVKGLHLWHRASA